MAAIDHSYDRLHDDLREVRDEMRAMRSEFADEMRAMRRQFAEEMRAMRRDLAGLRSDFTAMQGRLVQIGFGLVGTLLASLVALALALAK